MSERWCMLRGFVIYAARVVILKILKYNGFQMAWHGENKYAQNVDRET
jgi:hypothetical protein